MAIERISEIQGLPVVGRYYLVSCLESHPYTIPIIGPSHDDAEIIGFKEKHYHYDFRFIGKAQAKYEFKGDAIDSSQMVKVVGRYVGTVTEERRRCARQMPEFPLTLKDREGQPRHSPWQQKLENAYEHCKINIFCAICPHRGLPLNGLPVDEQGNVVCAGHGLAWNLETGKLVSRLPFPS